jgi:hypoxanthine phosphoribosyltransferase
MISPQLTELVITEVSQHVRSSKGYETESFINPLTPVDSVSAFVMAKLLAEGNAFDVCVSVAPEGHVYGYFFHLFEVPILSVHVDYPPRRCEILDDLETIRGKRVLILEDDVASGTTLRLVVNELIEYEPASIDLYLGRRKDSQILDSIHPSIDRVFIAEDHLDAQRRYEYEKIFADYFETRPLRSAKRD